MCKDILKQIRQTHDPPIPYTILFQFGFSSFALLVKTGYLPLRLCGLNYRHSGYGIERI